jgi:hypothetical protein
MPVCIREVYDCSMTAGSSSMLIVSDRTSEELHDGCLQTTRARAATKNIAAPQDGFLRRSDHFKECSGKR